MTKRTLMTEIAELFEIEFEKVGAKPPFSVLKNSCKVLDDDDAVFCECLTYEEATIVVAALNIVSGSVEPTDIESALQEAATPL